MDKSPDAFRTISEVADWLGVPAHVLRFWESRFTQVKPVKRAGGRRYYRPADMALLDGIRHLLHDDGMTIRAVQQKLRSEGAKAISSLSRPLDSEAMAPSDPDVSEAHADAEVAEAPMAEDVQPEESGTVLAFQRGRTRPPVTSSATPVEEVEPELDLMMSGALDEEPGPEAEALPAAEEEIAAPPDLPVEDGADELAGGELVKTEIVETEYIETEFIETETVEAEAFDAGPEADAPEPLAEDTPTDAEPVEVEPVEEPAEAAPAAFLVPDLPDDAEDEDPAFHVEPPRFSQIGADDLPQLREIADQLQAIRRRMGEAARRPPIG